MGISKDVSAILKNNDNDNVTLTIVFVRNSRFMYDLRCLCRINDAQE